MTALPQAFLDAPIAHRGLHNCAQGRPENSRAACRAALDAGYGIEIDLQLSRDGVAMVFHDETLERLTHQTGLVREWGAEALCATALTGGHEGVPTLLQVLSLVAGRVALLVELKDQHGAMGPTDGVLESAVGAALAGYSGPVAVMSFNPNMIARLAILLPDVPRGLVTCDYAAEDWPMLDEATRARLRGIPDYTRVGASFISHQARDLGRDRVRALRDTGAPVLTWTIRSAREEAQARQIAANITFENYLPLKRA